jgi:cardiolipin synthase A/B
MTSLAVMHTAWELVSRWAYWIGIAFAVVLLPFVLFSKRLPQAKIAWILGIFGFPWVGAFFYLTLGRNRLKRKVVVLHRRRVERFAQVDRLLEQCVATPGAAQCVVPVASVAEGGEGGGRAPRPIPGNEFVLLSNGKDAYASAREAIAAARHHIHIVVYIFKDDRTGRQAIEGLVAAARRGVEVRLLFDGLGSLATRRSVFEPLEAAGGRVAAFLPLNTLLRVNLRNHRKLLVVDGTTAFTGGMNVGDEYATDGDWHDVHGRVRGPAVPSLQRLFAEDWYFATEELIDGAVYYPATPPVGDVPVQILASGPDQEEPLAEEEMFALLASAKKSIDVMTPYLVPTEPIEAVLRSAARRGRRVRVLLGEKIDHRLVRWAGDSYIPDLMAAGVEVWRHPAMIHGKVLIVDDRVVSYGSTNLDARSLRLNFELNLTMPHGPTAERFLRHMNEEIAASNRVTLETLRCRFPTRFARAAAHLLSPLL